jgi:pyruvate dehydrogenase E1 component beta subunit
VGRTHRSGADVTVVAIGHLVQTALEVATDSPFDVEVWDPRSLFPFDWAGLAQSVNKTGRLVVIDDSNRTCGIAGEIIATASETMRLVAPPMRVTRPSGTVLPFALELDLALQPSAEQLREALAKVCA